MTIGAESFKMARVDALQQPQISVIVPIHDEEESIPQLYERLSEALANIGQDYEVIAVDDGSTDRSFALLQEFASADTRLRVIRFRRNFGQTAAFSAGFTYARGRIIITIDADLQNDPDDIELLLEKLDEGYDVVSGWRARRQDPLLLRRLPSQMANRLISTVTGVRLHDYGCSLKAYRSEVVKNIQLYGDLHRFIPAIASWQGVAVTELPVRHYARRFGRSKYGLSRTIRVILDLLTVRLLLSYSTRPMHIFGLLGIVLTGLGGFISMYLASIRLFLQQPIADRPLLLLGVLLIVVGIQLLLMGLLGELVVRTYYESQRKPIYVIREEINGHPHAEP